MSKTVGSFTLDEDGTITGPAAFMRSNDWLRAKSRIENGLGGHSDPVFAACVEHAPDFETAILVFVQTVYAGWHGMETFNRERGI